MTDDLDDTDAADTDGAADDRRRDDDAGDGPPAPAVDVDVDEGEVVRTAAEAAESVVFSRFSNADIEDLDVTVTFEEAVLEVDVYLNVPDPRGRDPDRVAHDAARAARAAVDDLFAGRE